jgi:diguanylate cyclase (GGDEF)-like protein/PAS domain S-box-containing protein
MAMDDPSAARALATLASLAEAVVRVDAGGRIDYLNPAAEALLDLPAAEALGRAPTEVYRMLGELTRSLLEDPLARCLAEGQTLESEGHTALVTPGGREFPVRFTAAPVRAAAGGIVGAVLVLRDATELRQVERRMSYLASHDPLTGLANRREFEACLEDALEDAREQLRRPVVFYLDLDEFKRINDRCGHLAGDELLRQVASLLLSRVRATDVLARLGGDEFAVVLRECPFDKALSIADSMRQAIKDFRFSWETEVFEVGVSIGVVPVAERGDMAQILRAADAACYMAKEKGRNRIHIFQPGDAAAASRYGDMQWIHRLGDALEQDRFRLFVQEIRPLGGNGREPLGEILLRMVELGELLSPAAFVPAAERYRLMTALDRWVVRSAFRQIPGQVGSPGRPRCFGVNLSAQSLSDAAFLDFLLRAVKASNVPPDCICFELTETAVVANLASAQQFLAAVRRAGCRASLDDFGSGLASFGYLRNLQVDFLKIDGEYVKRVAEDPLARALVESIHRVAHALGVETIAEWVESEAALAVLEEIGVDYAQGYWIGGPRPLDGKVG